MKNWRVEMRVIECTICMNALTESDAHCCATCLMPVHAPCAKQWQERQNECPMRCSMPWVIQKADLSVLKSFEAATYGSSESRGNGLQDQDDDEDDISLTEFEEQLRCEQEGHASRPQTFTQMACGRTCQQLDEYAGGSSNKNLNNNGFQCLGQTRNALLIECDETHLYDDYAHEGTANFNVPTFKSKFMCAQKAQVRTHQTEQFRHPQSLANTKQ